MNQTTAELTQLNEQLHQEIAERRRVEAALCGNDSLDLEDVSILASTWG